MTATFEFDAAFQAKVAALALRDTEFLRMSEGLVAPEQFENETDGYLVDIALGHFKTYRCKPSGSSLINEIRKRKKAKLLREDTVDAIKERLPHLMKKVDISDRDYVVDQVAEFARHQAVTVAILESAEILDKTRDFEVISEKLRKALEVGANSSTPAYDYFEMAEERTKIRKDTLSGLIKPNSVTTGLVGLDKLLYRKGWGKKELSILMGAAKAGKTTALCDFAKNATIAGFNVCYITLEVAAEIIADRIDGNIADMALRYIPDHAHEVEDKVKAMEKRAGEFEILEYPTGTLKPSELRRVLHKAAAEGKKYDLVVIDYLDLMAPDVYTREPRENSRLTWIDVRAIAQMEEVAILSATQTNRDGAKAVIARDTDVAEDYNKIRIADLVLSINVSEEERAKGEARLFFAASRNQAGGFSVRIKQDLERGRFLSKILGIE